MIFDETTLAKLNRLALVSRQVRAGVLKGERRSLKRGSSLEFADYRSYAPGDELRRLDWNVYARLDRPFLKLFEEEEDLVVHLLLDGSRSMDWGSGEQHKFHYAQKLAAALGAIALSGGDRLEIGLLHDRPGAHFGPARGEFNVLRMLQFLEGLTPGGEMDLEATLRAYAQSGRRPGLAVLISDLFFSTSLPDSLGWLQRQGFEVIVVHLLAPDEIDPPLSGDLRLVDVENGQFQEVSVDGSLRRLYRQRLEAWQAGIFSACRQRNVRCLGVSTAQPWDQVVLHEMRRGGVVK
ncbi:MAG: DUF58 domain-containing protein [Chloroflexi bacterium]|nr:DUF58 domain-containing protein [Chloroflexota bacterium]